MTDTAVESTAAQALERVLVQGDLSGMTLEQRITYFEQVCQSTGLNPLTRPFQFIKVRGQNGEPREILYATRDATDQLRTLHGVSVTKLERDYHDDLYVVTAYVTNRAGRTDVSTGAVGIGQFEL